MYTIYDQFHMMMYIKSICCPILQTLIPIMWGLQMLCYVSCVCYLSHPSRLLSVLCRCCNIVESFCFCKYDTCTCIWHLCLDMASMIYTHKSDGVAYKCCERMRFARDNFIRRTVMRWQQSWNSLQILHHSRIA